MGTMRRRWPAVVLTIVLLAVAPMEAWADTPGPDATERVTVGTSGRPGRVTTMPLVVGSHSAVWDGFAWGWSPWVRQGGPIVTRSPRNPGAQRACVTYVLQIWRSGWMQQAQRTGCSPIGTGQARVRLPGFDVPGLNAGNWFRMVHYYAWWHRGRRAGTRVVALTSPREYRCNTAVQTCYVNSNGLCLRGPSTGRCR
jgi:hypothetical protein